MSDSTPPHNSNKLYRLRRQLGRTKPAVDGLFAVSKLWDNIKKVVQFCGDLIGNPIVLTVLATLAAAGFLPKFVIERLPQQAQPALKQRLTHEEFRGTQSEREEETKKLTLVEPRKRNCLPSHKRVRERLRNAEGIQDTFRQFYRGHELCGWYLRVGAEPVRDGETWRVLLKGNSGLRVILEARQMPPLSHDDVVFAGGRVTEARTGPVFDPEPTLIIKNGWVQKQ